jgi:apolipoprotein N-acyltransferase
MQKTEARRGVWRLGAAGILSAALLELPFPLAGPMPPWRGIFAWFGLIPLLWAILSPACTDAAKPLRRSFLTGYFSGFLWYCGNCYWVRDTMAKYGELPAIVPVLLLIGYSAVLGLYFGFFAWGVALVYRATGSVKWALAAAPVLWAAMEMAASRITSVPWDQLGYSQVDNGFVNQLAPWTGVYGISFVLVAANVLIARPLLVDWGTRRSKKELVWAVIFALGMFSGVQLNSASLDLLIPKPAGTATAVLIQPNLDVGRETRWAGPGEWDQHIADFTKLAGKQCGPYIAGIPQTWAATGEVACPPVETPADLIVWPESPAPFDETDPRFQKALAGIAHTVQAPLVVGNIGWDFDQQAGLWHYFNSALIVGADGAKVGRYDKVHLVPFGEYIPFQNLLKFAHKLTGRVSTFSRGDGAKVFRLNGHRYGVFICYESVFAEEVRQFSRLGAEVLVNISDDGWYGDTSAPWQHLNMVRMRAIENRRWILRDTNNGVTAVIDPEGRVRQSIARHQLGALPAQFGFRDDITFYTAHGDVFGWVCAVVAVALIVMSVERASRKQLNELTK